VRPFGRTLRILGTHGVPAAYGGFETAAEISLSFFVTEAGGCRILQELGSGPIRYDEWNGIERVTISVPREGWLGGHIAVRPYCRSGTPHVIGMSA